MKKASCFSLVVIVLLVLCNSIFADPDRLNSNLSRIPPNPVFCVSYDLLAFGDVAEYETYMRKALIMPEFVTYEMLRELGNFDGAYASDTRWRNIKTFKITDCYYSFESGISLNVYVKPIEAEARKSQNNCTQIYHYTEDLRQSASDGYCILQLKGVQYRYINGELSSIQWETPSNVFKLGIDEADKVGREAGTLMSYILYSRTSVLAITALSTTIELCLLFQKVRCVAWIVAIPWFLFAMLQLFDLPPVLSKKVRRMEDAQQRRGYRRRSGIVKLVVAAVFAGTTLMGLREPLAMLICTVLAIVLLVLAVKQQAWLDTKYLPQPADIQSEPL